MKKHFGKTYLINYKMQGKITSLQKLSFFLSFLLCSVSLQGLYDFGNNSLILFGIWLIVVFVAYPKTLSKVLLQRRFLSYYVFLIFYFLSLFYNHSFSICINNIVSSLFVFSPILMYETIKDHNQHIKGLFVFGALLVLVVNVIASFAFMELLSVSTMRDHVEYGEEFFIVKVAFNICSSLSFVIPAMIFVVKNNVDNRLNKTTINILLMIVVVFFFAFLIRAQYVTSVFIALLGMIVTLFYKKGHLFRFVMISMILFGLGLAFINPLIKTMNSLDEKYSILTQKLIEIENTITGNKTEAADINDRNDRSSMSIKTFLDNPVFGVSYKINDAVHVQDQGIGNHASWPDTLARFGLFSFFLFYFLYDSLKRQSVDIKSKLIMLLFVLLGFLNPTLLFPQIFSAFLFVPLLFQYFSVEQYNL